MGNVFTAFKGFFASGTILASIGTLIASLDQLVAALEQVQPFLPPKASAAAVSVLAVIAIIRRVVANTKIGGLF